MSINPYEEERPWGRFRRFTQNEPSTVKILTIKPGEELSLQTHAKREEFWHVISGKGSAVVGDKTVEITPGKEIFVSTGYKHTIRAETEVIMLEIALGDFDEEDIVRLHDKYNRKVES